MALRHYDKMSNIVTEKPRSSMRKTEMQQSHICPMSHLKY
jgi:hypothetical protein